MYNSYLKFNIISIYCVVIVLIGMLIYAILAKIIHDYFDRRHKLYQARFTKELNTLFFPRDDEQVAIPFSLRLENYYEENIKFLDTQMPREIFEDVLMQLMDSSDDALHMGRETARRFSFGEDAIVNLKSNRISRQLRGCQHGGAYLYEPAIPLILKLLWQMSANLQYSALIALSDFGRPDLVVEGFQIIEKAVLVNDRVIRRIVDKMGDRKTELFNAIIKMNSPILVPLFLKSIDIASTNENLDTIIFMIRSGDMELRIAAIRALAQTGNKKIVPELVHALQAEEWEVRAAAAKSLQSVPTLEAGTALLLAMNDKAWWVRQNAAVAILSMPNCNYLIQQILLSEDASTVDSLYHAADTLGMMDVVTAIKEADITYQHNHHSDKAQKSAVSAIPG